MHQILTFLSHCWRCGNICCHR